MLSGDLGQELARGRDAYLSAFSGLARINASPLLPLSAGELSITKLTPSADSIELDWCVPVRIRTLPGVGSVELSGRSTYTMDPDGSLSAHRLSDLRLEKRPLPSTVLAELLSLTRGASTSSPVTLIATLAKALQQPATPPPSGPPAAKGASSVDDDNTWPPLPGTSAWSEYEATHFAAATLAAQFQTLLEFPPDLSSSASLYAEDMTLRSAAGNERLVSGREQYAQLLSSLIKVHQAVSASPLLTYTYSYSVGYRGETAPWTRLGDGPPASEPPPAPPPLTPSPTEAATDADAASAAGADAPTEKVAPTLTVSWTYALHAATAPGATPSRVFTLEAHSDFAFVDTAAAESTDADRAPSGRYVINTHTLRGLTVNSRPALPAALLEQLSRAETSAPELLQFVSSAFLKLSDQLIPPVAPGARGASRATATSPATVELSTLPLEPAYALGFTALIRSLHRQLPTLLLEPPDFSICAPNVQLRGLLRERLAEGVPSLGAFFTAVRRLYAALLSEGALMTTQQGGTKSDGAAGVAADGAGASPLEYKLLVTPESDIIVEFALESTLGRSWEGAGGLLGSLGVQQGSLLPPLRVGLPVRIRGELRLRPDATTAALNEVWIRSLSINERPLLPKMLNSWVQQGSASALSADVARDVRTVASALLPWLNSGR